MKCPICNRVGKAVNLEQFSTFYCNSSVHICPLHALEFQGSKVKYLDLNSIDDNIRGIEIFDFKNVFITGKINKRNIDREFEIDPIDVKDIKFFIYENIKGYFDKIVDNMILE